MVVNLNELIGAYNSELSEKIQNLKEFFIHNKKIALGFSGGVDSTILLYAGLSFGADIRPYYVKSVFQPDFELEDAVNTANLLGTNIILLKADVLSTPMVAENPPNRCYFCKQGIFGMLKEKAASDGYTVIIDGTNASDDASDRPGMVALKEFGVVSPLREFGFCKIEIRQILKDAGIHIWYKPAYSCLATRVATGEKITAELLSKIEKAEEMLFSFGFCDFRVRVSQNRARLQFVEGEIDKANAMKDKIIKAIKQNFDDVSENFEIRKSHG